MLILVVNVVTGGCSNLVINLLLRRVRPALLRSFLLGRAPDGRERRGLEPAGLQSGERKCSPGQSGASGWHGICASLTRCLQ